MRRPPGLTLTAQQPDVNIVRIALRRWPRCWAERNRCTPIRATKLWRCRPRNRRASRCGRSRLSRTRPASRKTPDPVGGSEYIEGLTDRSSARPPNTSTHRSNGRHPGGNRDGLYPNRDPQCGLRISAAGRKRGNDRGWSESLPAGRDGEAPSSGWILRSKLRKWNRCARCAPHGAYLRRRNAWCARVRRPFSRDLMPFIVAAAASYATVGEISDRLRHVFGEYRKPSLRAPGKTVAQDYREAAIGRFRRPVLP